MNICEKCCHRHTGKYGSGRFCSSNCAHSFSTSKNRKNINEKISIKLKGKKRDPRNPKGVSFVDKICPVCSDSYRVSWSLRNQKTCGSKCRYSWQFNPKNPNYARNKKSASEAGRKSVQSQKETKRSKNEIRFAEMCQRRWRGVLCNEPIFNKWDADVILTNQKVAVLWNGVWHRRKLFEGHNLKQVQSRDKIKLHEIEQCGYTAYIVDDPAKENKAFVEAEFEKFVKWINNHSIF